MMDGSQQAPQYTAKPIGPDHVGLSVQLWYATFMTSMTPTEAYNLARHLCTAAEEAEALAEVSSNG
jgi:hypothetical protein